MRILSKLIFVVLLPFLFTACQSYKKVPYLQDTEVINQTEQKEKLYDAKIMPKDLLTIVVSCTSPELAVRGEKRNVSICGRLENDWLLWLSKRYDEVGESDLEKRNVYIALHWAYILASFERRSNGLLYIEGRIGEISGLFTGYSPWTFPDQLSYTKIVKRIGLCKWSGGMPDALPFFILSKLFHIDNIWYICSQINAI